MNELTSYYYYEDRVITPATHQYRVYHADEADKVIADLIEKNKRLARKDIIMASNAIKDVYKELRHSKYKRCLAMAKLCESNVIWVKGCSEWRRWKKWHERWLKIAEKFKSKAEEYK